MPRTLANQKKHGISFEEASELFTSGGDYLEIFDGEHSEVEDRFYSPSGRSRGGVVLAVWTERDEDVVRLHQRALGDAA